MYENKIRTLAEALADEEQYDAGSYDIAVVGAGHAGCEAAAAATRLGFKTILFTAIAIWIYSIVFVRLIHSQL